MTSVGLSAFCHISEYGEKGYAYLPQMVMLGRPLTLWAPSSRLILAHSGLSTKEFLDLVDSQNIRVLGRERWLTSKDERDDHPYPDARWTPEVDDTLSAWCEQDAAKPPGQQRVVTAPREDGYEWADQYLGEQPQRITTWYDRYRRSPHSLPSGTLDTIERNIARAVEKGEDERYAVARTILRDGRNHGQAFQLAGSDVSVHLSKVSLQFIQVLNDESGRPTILSQRSAEPTPSEAITAELTLQTVELLRWLREAAGTGPMSLHQFLEHDAREELLDWLRRVCQEYRLYPPSALDGVVLAQLERDLAHGAFASAVVPPWRWGDGGLDSTAGLVGIVTSLLDAAVGGVSAIGYAGFGALTFSATRTLLRALGYIPTSFSGPNWPFLFALDKPPTKSRMAKLLKLVRGHPDR